jgi:hypothetical protein
VEHEQRMNSWFETGEVGRGRRFKQGGHSTLDAKMGRPTAVTGNRMVGRGIGVYETTMGERERKNEDEQTMTERGSTMSSMGWPPSALDIPSRDVRLYSIERIAYTIHVFHLEFIYIFSFY